MRVWRFIIGGFITRRGFQFELGFWFKTRHWLTVLVRSVMGSGFFGLSGNWYGPVSYGLKRAGPRWCLINTLFLWWIRRKEKQCNSN